MRWLAAVEHLRSRGEAGVLVTVTAVRGHAPRDAGAKMVVSATTTWDSIGGGALEAVAIEVAREMISGEVTVPESFTSTLSDKVVPSHGVQCCGGEVTVLLEPMPVRPSVAVFGMGHVGHELARILARHDVDLHLVDTRAERFEADLMAPLRDADARVHVHSVPLLPEQVLVTLPPGTHVLVMTHDHAEDHAIVDAALRMTEPRLGTIGLIGSSAKWTRMRQRLLGDGLTEADVDRVVTPIGLPGVGGKDPAVIAVSVAADLVQRMHAAVGPAPAARHSEETMP